MKTIKAFYKDGIGIYLSFGHRKLYYEIGMTYKCRKERVRINEYGYHASANCDVSEALQLIQPQQNITFCIIDLNVVDKSDNIVVGDKMKILRELTHDECLNYDKSGKWNTFLKMKEQAKKIDEYLNN